IALLREFGLSYDQIRKGFSQSKIVKTRFEELQAGDLRITMIMAKGQNPIACSRVFNYIRSVKGQKAVLILVDDMGDASHSSENIAWIHEADFEFLNQEDIRQIVIGGVRSQDFRVRLLLAGVPAEKIHTFPKEIESADLVNFEDAEKIFILYDVYTIHLAQGAKARLLDRMEGGKESDH
ncbi:MAG: DUF1727 domain-containing protein, partial [Clostridia bacterium]|nr:DUF1727 domain-containing protein [Clostridia bacterium]